jgi:hypothetical protein
MDVKFFKFPMQKKKLLIKPETIKEQCRPQIGNRKWAQFQKLQDADRIKLHVTQQNKQHSFDI